MEKYIRRANVEITRNKRVLLVKFVHVCKTNFAAIFDFCCFDFPVPPAITKIINWNALPESAINEIIALLLTNQIAVILSCI